MPTSSAPTFRSLAASRSWLPAPTSWKTAVYLIQHSAGSGKSNTIAWLAHQLVELKTAADAMLAQFDSVIVITDRRALDTQIARTIKSYDHVASIFGHSEDAAELRTFLRKGKKIIVTTVQKFPFILDELGDLGGKKFALLIDEAHSSQGGKTTAKMHMALSGVAGDDEDDDESVEDAVNKLIESRKMLPNARRCSKGSSLAVMWVAASLRAATMPSRRRTRSWFKVCSLSMVVGALFVCIEVSVVVARPTHVLVQRQTRLCGHRRIQRPLVQAAAQDGGDALVGR